LRFICNCVGNYNTFQPNKMAQNKTIVVIGGGAAGYMAAITCAETNSDCRVIIVERGKETLEKVRISGGGRCNVTHACYDPRELVKFYPRGSRELLGAFTRFQSADTVEWFEKRGVSIKTEDDGRMFPESNTSATIVQCLQQAAKNAGVEVAMGVRIEKIIDTHHSKNPYHNWTLRTGKEGEFKAFAVMIAAGSSTAVWQMLFDIGYQIVPPVPSLFTFNCKDERIKDLLGISLPKVNIAIKGTKLTTEGAFLITHWGMSGPAVLRLSAWAARELADKKYQFTAIINFTGMPKNEAEEEMMEYKNQNPRKFILNNALFDLPTRLWERLVVAADIDYKMKWADIPKTKLRVLLAQITEAEFEINGKSTFKEEFVTCGGVALSQINFKTMESKIHRNLFFAGEILDIDAITGGFNFQAAWTCGWLAGQHLGGE
jgi:predicted Rossmann fold flavoprotein